MKFNTKNCGFSFDHYREILFFAKKHYRILQYSDFRMTRPKDGKILVLRHDVDQSLEIAEEMAELEGSLRVPSTYFVRLDALGYNTFSYSSLSILRRIRELGHEIGLHYSASFSGQLGMKSSEFVKWETEILSNLAGAKVVSGAPHEPSRVGTSSEREFRKKCGLKVDAYDPVFIKSMKYLSDSGGRWREGCACQYLGTQPSLCVLTHPFWWYSKTPLERY